MGMGSHVVASSALYGGTVNLLNHTPASGSRPRLVHPRDLEQIDAAVRPETRLLIVETIGKPGLRSPTVGDGRHRPPGRGCPLLVDNTFAHAGAVPSMEHGADLVVHSATK